MNTHQKIISQTLIAASLIATALPASADRGKHDRHHASQYRHGWHGDIRHFNRYDAKLWHTGKWRHDRHDGRLGWWWVAAGTWYFYTRPVYPYPDPYTPPVVVINPPVVVSAPPQIVPAPAVQYWYFCTAANEYYPYVSSCPEGWKTVPATPALASNAPSQY